MTATPTESVRKEQPYHARGFWALIATQFQGAFNDNLYRFIIVFYMIALYATPETKESVSMQLTALGTILFSVPYLAFPGLAGALADRFSKRTITIATKFWEVGVMAVGLYAFYHGSPKLIFFMLYMMFMQSAFFSPAKYGILPELMPESRLSWGNGILQMGTFVAIIAGQGIAGVLFERVHIEGVQDGPLNLYIVSGLLIVLSVAGLCTSFAVTKLPPASPRKRIPINPWSGLGKYFKMFYADHVLWLSLLGGGFFWFVGAMIQANVVPYGTVSLGVKESWVAFLIAMMMVGIGVGSVAAGHLSRGKIELGLIPIGIAGMTVSGFLLALVHPPYWGACAMLFSVGFFGGFFEIPIAATVQYRTPKKSRGGMIAAFNIATCIGVLTGGGVMLVCGRIQIGGFSMSSYNVFLVAAITSLIMLIYLFWVHPVFVLRSGLWFLGNTIYRLRVMGRPNVPERGGALLVANHTSFIDALIILASIDRPIRFLMAKEIYRLPTVGALAKIAGAIPVSSMAGPKELAASLKEATEAIDNGDLVCIFAEGQVSRTGQMLPFRKGFEHIMKRVDAPIIPVHLDRLWASVFGFSGGRFFWKVPQRIPFPVTVSFGNPMAHDASAAAIRKEIQILGAEAYDLRKADQPLLHRRFIRWARIRPLSFAMADQKVPEIRYFKSLVGAIVFARKFRSILGEHEKVGLLIPQSVGASLSNIAVMIMGKIPVNLNYTASPDAIRYAVELCEIKHVLTSREFLKRFPVEVPGEPIYLEDVRESVTGFDRLAGLLLAAVCPVRLLERLMGSPGGRSVEDVATIIFSSGSEGDPKGVMLTHHNIISNVEQPLQVFPYERTDRMMGIIPFFHSLGFMGTLWLPLCTGMGVIFHPNPLEAKPIGQQVYKYKPRFMIATPTFLQNFIRRCLPEELSSLEFIIVGAEKLPARIREAFNAKFGVEPLEGYGTTECAPLVSLNVPDFRAPGYYQVGTKHGTVGHPMPGQAVRIIHPDTGEEILDDKPGVLLVKGPNIMPGYYKKPEKTAEVLQDGWYNTGDIASIDEDGFLTITGRVSRFSKIAGEMVSHARVEEELHRLLSLTDQAFCVASVPDVRKGERLVVLHTVGQEEIQEVVEKLDSSALPNLWRPRAADFYRIDEIPILGTGKVDLKRLKTMARELDIGE